MDTLGKDGHIRYIAAHGLSVGLNDGLMGNSEVGYVLLLYLHHMLRLSVAASDLVSSLPAIHCVNMFAR